ncbi:serine/threonine-protein kinase HAL4/sat4 [Linnemannia exigua]|uniref:non-specific serine/threonine protein kinase n=1 Tax=Linnemannia exigua TaxID=604196 RepID=A0AAD4DL73_9FUNG|nr:serine/threonine-protein kinase HAL4/sat4 [Linnemannia exigua]
MSFHVPSEELDFTIYGDANTNQLQLSPSQHRLIQKQQRLAAAVQQRQEELDQGGPNLTGYQSGLFDHALGRKQYRESKKKQTSVVFADPPCLSLVVDKDAPSHLQQQQQQQEQERSQQQPQRRKASRYGSMKIDTSLETIQAPLRFSSSSSSHASRAKEPVQQPHRQKQQVQQQHQQNKRSYHLSGQSQSFPTTNPVTDQAVQKKEEGEQSHDRENHTLAAAGTSVVVLEKGDISRSQPTPSAHSTPPLSSSQSSQRHPRHHPFSTTSVSCSSSYTHKKHNVMKNTTSADNEEEGEQDAEAVVQSLEVVVQSPESNSGGVGLLNEPEEGSPSSLSVLQPPMARSATIISTTSSSGRPRLTHRLSYLAHLQDLEVDEDEDVVTPLTPAVAAAATPTAHRQLSTTASFSIPLSAPLLPSTSMAPESFSARRTSLPVKQTMPPPPHTTRAPQPQSKQGSSATAVAVGGSSQKSPLPHQSVAIAAPPIPKLYKRLLRVFKPPTDSSDSDHGTNHPSEQSPPVSSNSRSPFGFPSESHHSTSRGGSKSAPSSKRPSLSNAPPAALPVLPSLANVAKASNGAPHKSPETTSSGGGGGFRARFLRKLMSSPNLNASVYPASSNSAPSSRVDLTKLDISLATEQSSRSNNINAARGGWKNNDVDDHHNQQPPSPYSPLPLDFEHDHSCPAGQRITERRTAGRPRSATTSRVPPQMPTLQSKYGVPGRELGAGTQAQVMLLRVKSSKRLRSPKNKNVASWPKSGSTPSSSSSQQQKQRQQQPSSSPYQQRESLSPVDPDIAPATSDSLLTPYMRTGTLMTTTEDEVTPEQREAYRKRLLRRTSTGGLSMTKGGGLIYAIKKFRPPRATETHRQFLKKVCAEFCISTSMDHENIIRTLDLVRDQPGQELTDDNDIPYQDSQHKHKHGHRRSSEPQHHSRHDEYDDDEEEYVRTEQHRREEARDCSCPRIHHRRVRTVKSAGDLCASSASANQGHSGSSASNSSSPSSKHRPIVRKSVISKPQRKRSMDTLSTRRSNIGHPDRAPAQQPVGQGSKHRHLYHWRSDAHHHASTSSQVSDTHALEAALKKKKQQQEQELRQKEVLRLKQQREREKQQAKQLRLDQFPEYCMVMEFAAGGDLFNLLTKSHPPISLHEKHCLWRQLINGVQYMHSMGVAHRDLKPENILIDGTGRILKITDFGIANVFKSVGDPIPLPCRGIIGSEPYIAPEEFYQEEYDPRAVDVWACGIIFYVMYYAAMPWARADRKKDARFSRYISDIMNHRHSETQRRLQYERRKLHHQSLASSASGSGSLRSGSGSGSGSGLGDAYNRPHEVSHHRQYPPYNPNQYQHQHQQQQDSSSIGSSSRSGSPTSPQSSRTAAASGGDGTIVETPQSSVNNSPVSSNPIGPLSPSTEPLISSPASATLNALSPALVPPPAVYNTFSYNGYLGGHEFIDRIEIPGCRRILYAILEPDARKRVTIDQVLADEWVSQIRYCTDNLDAQEEQAALAFGRESSSLRVGGGGERYLCLPDGQLHHRHAVPKKVKLT